MKQRDSRVLLSVATISITGIAISAFVFAFVWQLSLTAMDNIVNAAEAGIADTVSQTTWLGIDLGFLALATSLTAVFIFLPLRPFRLFEVWENLLSFSLPTALLALTPVLGAEIPILSAILMTATTSLCLERHRRKPGL